MLEQTPDDTKINGGAGRGRADGAGSKLATVVADQIIGLISRRGWPEGEVVGSEAQLLERFEVSRAVLREAIRLLEHLEVARMRRGPGGGLVVMPASLDSVTDAVSVYLYYIGAEIDEVFEARYALEETAAELAPSRLGEVDIHALRDLVEREQRGDVVDHRELHRLVAATTGNPALEAFVDLLNRVTLLYLSDGDAFTPTVRGASGHAHVAIASAILAGDGGLARRRMRKHLQAEADFLRRRKPSRARLAEATASVEASDKLAERTARLILAEVASAGWPAGELLGSEAELMARFDVSRAVLREAVRLLEHHQVARMRRGPGGGLFVAEPGAEAVTEALAINLGRRGIEPAHLFEVRRAIELAVLDRAMAAIDEAGSEVLRSALAAERAASEADFAVVGHDLHGVIAQVSGNRVLELLTLVLVRLSRTRAAMPRNAPEPVPSAAVIRVHDKIVEAMLAGDVELARHRMRRHLDALTDWVR